MYAILIISSFDKDAGIVTDEKLMPQVQYLRMHKIKVKIMKDPERLDLEKELLTNYYNLIYITTLYRFFRDSTKHLRRDYNYSIFLEQLGYRYAGSNSLTQFMLLDKTLCSNNSGIAPEGKLVTRELFHCTPPEKREELFRISLRYPLIVKPNSFSASLGVDNSSIIRDQKSLLRKVTEIFDRFQNLNEIRIEEFIENSREFTVSILGNGFNTIHSVIELKFRNKDSVYSENDKKVPTEAREIKYSCDVENSIREELIFHTKRLFNWFGMKDFGRFDYRYDSRAYLLEINALPDPANSFSWEWQKKGLIKKNQTLALQLLPSHFRNMNSGIPSPLPDSLIEDFSDEIINPLKHSLPCDMKPESTPPNTHCPVTDLYSMSDRISAEGEVLHFLKSLVILTKPRLILETGTYKGTTSIAFATGLLENGIGKLITIEKDISLAKKFKSKIQGLPIEVINTNSLDYTPKFKIDLLYLDSHRPIRIKEFFRFRPFLSKGAVIIWHDSSPEHKSVYNAIEELYSQKIIDRILLPTPRGLTLSMLK